MFEIFIAKNLIRPNSKDFFSRISFISILTVFVSVFLPIFVLGLINSFHNSVKERMIATDFHFQVVDSQNRMIDYQEISDMINKNFNSLVSMPFFEGYGIVLTDFDKIPVIVRGVSDNFIDFVNVLKIKEGKWDLSGYNTIIGYGIAKRLGIKVGDILKIYVKVSTEYDIEVPLILKRIKVSGIFSTGYDSLDDSFLFTSFKTGQGLFDYKDKASGVGVFIKSEEAKNYDENLNLLRVYLKNIAPTYRINDWERLNANLLFSFKWEKTIMTVVLIIIIIACLFSVYVGYNVVISDKRIALGILGILGLDGFMIKKVFIIKGLIMGIIGVIAGLSLSGLILNNIYYIISFIVRFFNIVGISFLSSKTDYTSSLGLSWDFIDIFLISFLNIFIVILAVFFPVKEIEKQTISEMVRNS